MMRRQAWVQVAQTAQYAVAKCLPTSDRASRLHGWRSVVAWATDQLSESCHNLVDLSDIRIMGFWHEPEALDLTAGDVLARQRWAHAALPGLCKPQREGTA